MANVIKHKRGSGSDPSASDLILGELAIRTDTGKLFTKMDSGAIAEIAGGGSDIAINTLSSSSATGGGSATFNGSAYRFTLSAPPNVSAAQLLVSINGVIQKPVAGTGQPSEGFSVDGTDIILGDAPATGSDFFILTFKSLGVSEPADNSVTSAKIVDGAIVNADINASAAIAGSKLNPVGLANVGIGTTSPNQLLEVANSSGGATISISTDEQAGSQASKKYNNLDFTGYNNNVMARIQSWDESSNTGHGYLTFFTNKNGVGFTEKLRIDPDGNVGIGTTSPSTKLHLFGAASDFEGLRLTNNLRNDSAASSAQIKFDIRNSGGLRTARIEAREKNDNNNECELNFYTNSSASQNGEEERMTISGTGNVGIGTTSPDEKLHVANTSGGASILIETNNSSGGNILFGDDASNTVGRIQYLHSDNSMRLNTAGSERMRITSSGDLGIGTTSPQRLLHQHENSSAANYHVFTNTGTGSSSSDGGIVGIDASENLILWNQENTNLRFATNNNERMRIKSDGTVGIGTTDFTTVGSPNKNFVVGSTTNAQEVATTLNVMEGTNNRRVKFFLDDDDGVFGIDSTASTGVAPFVIRMAQSEKLRMDQSGNVGIGTTSPSHLFHVNGNARVGKLLVNASGGHNDSRVNIIGTSTGSHTNIRCADSAGNQLLLLRNDGPFFVSAVYSQTTSAGANVNVQSNGNIVRSTSSVRYKKDITDATWGLTEVLKLKPKTFKNNAKDEYADEKTYGGFTAEDVHDLGLTEFVEYDKDNKPDALFYGNMVALMAKAIQDLNAKVEALEAN